MTIQELKIDGKSIYIFLAYYWHIKMSIQEHQIKLNMFNRHHDASLIKLWNYLVGKLPVQIHKILCRMRMKLPRLLRFLEFMHNVCLHDHIVGYSQERLEQYQIILMCCPRQILTQYLLSSDEHCVVNLLEQRDVIWTMYLVGLIELRYYRMINGMLHNLMQLYGSRFGLNIILLLIREASNLDLPHQLRQTIFDFVCQDPNMVRLIVEHENGQPAATIQESISQMNQWSRTFSEQNGLEGSYEWSFVRSIEDPRQPQHREVNAEAFVCATFPSQHPLVPKREYICGICQSSSNEKTEDGSSPIFRSIPCCGHKQVACHGCLVRCATLCNTPDHQNEFKDTDVFVCPFCRAKRKFFPDEN